MATSVIRNIEDAPYAIFIGDVGSGKSTIVEKLTGEEGLGSDASQSVTRSFELYWSFDFRLLVGDTPGSNPMTDKLGHNMEIAHGLNFHKVSKMFMTVAAQTRIDQTVDMVTKYFERFLALEQALDVMGVMVTHMDTVKWTEAECRAAMDNELGLDTVLFSSLDKSAETLLDEVVIACSKLHIIAVDDSNFLKLFKISNSNVKILRSSAREVEDFKEIRKAFAVQRDAYPSSQEQVDLTFEFQAYMAQEIVEAQKRMAEENSFTFEGPQAANEAGHIANMTNQLRAILYDIRIESCKFQGEGASDLRKCPHCGLVWTKIEGCDGATTCGNRMMNWDFRWGVMATFSFEWVRTDKDRHRGLRILKTGNRNLNLPNSFSSQGGAGCGNSINWSNMAKVTESDLPEGFRVAKIGTEDIQDLPMSAYGFCQRLKAGFDCAKANLNRLGSKARKNPEKNQEKSRD